MKFLSKKHSEIAKRIGCILALPQGTELDFVGSHEQARKNAELVWPKHIWEEPIDIFRQCIRCGFGRGNFTNLTCANHMRHQIIDSEDGVALIEKALEERNKDGVS